MKQANIIFFLTLSFSLTLNAFKLKAQNAASKEIQYSSTLPKKEKSLNKLTSGLQEIHHHQQAQHLRQENPVITAKLSKLFDMREQTVAVELIAKNSLAELSAALSQINFEERSRYGKIISGYIDKNQLSALNNLVALQYARPIYKPITQIGAVDSQGDAAQQSDAVRGIHGLDGSGIKIGILSDSYNNLSGEATGVASGDLPGPGNPEGHTTPVTIVKDLAGSGSDEARGMAEIIHDVAPAAQLFARTAFDGEADFAQGILDLASLGCDVIVDDISYFAEPFFQEGLIAQAVNTVVTNNDVVYLTSAGNMGDKSYENPGFRASAFTLGGNPVHDFDPGAADDPFQLITIPAGVTLTMTLQWDDPFGSLPGSVAGADTDMDIYMLNSQNAIISQGTSINISTGDPYEIISYTNATSAAMEVKIIIAKYQGPDPTYLKYVCWTNSITIETFDTKSSTIVGHANAAQSIAVGAVAYYNTPEYGVSPAVINNFSSIGGTPVFYDDVGNRITTIVRDKPEMSAPDGANTTFFGSDITQDSDAHPNFFGTSAAAPHLAGAAVLLKEMGATTRTEVLDAFQTTALDMDDPSTGANDVGFDYGTGFGLLHVPDAVSHLISLPIELVDFSIERTGKNAGLIKWSSSSEYNNKKYILEHQSNHKSFHPIAKISGKGNSSQLNQYEQQISNLPAGINYFRLWQEDMDGQLTEHGVVSLTVEQADDLVWTYSEQQAQFIVVDSKSNGEALVNIYNSAGALMNSKTMAVNREEKHIFDCASQDWISGAYFYEVRLTGNQGRHTYYGKFIK